MNVTISPGKLSGSVTAVASKSHAHRLLIAAALSGTTAEVGISTTSKDIEATKACLEQLNNNIPVLNCGESGSTLRFMIPVAMALKEEAVFMGSGRLPHRPLNPLDSEMEAHGCKFETVPAEDEELQEICRIRGRLKAGEFSLPGNISSQYITGLLFALPLLEGNSTIRVTSPLESAKYIDMTLDVLEQFGIEIKTTSETGCPVYDILGGQKYIPPGNITAEGDWSNIAFWVIAGALSGGSGITCCGLDPQSLQGDKAIAELALQMGANVSWNKNAPDQLTIEKKDLKALEIDAAEIPDLVPVLAVAASTAAGTTRIYNAGRLRIKESDRLAAMYDCLSKVGADITEEADGLIIRGVPQLTGGTVCGYNDHRIVMAMTIASLVSENPIIIEGAEAVSKSYPGFFDDFKSLGGEIRVI